MCTLLALLNRREFIDTYNVAELSSKLLIEEECFIKFIFNFTDKYLEYIGYLKFGNNKFHNSKVFTNPSDYAIQTFSRCELTAKKYSDLIEWKGSDFLVEFHNHPDKSLNIINDVFWGRDCNNFKRFNILFGILVSGEKYKSY